MEAVWKSLWAELALTPIRLQIYALKCEAWKCLNNSTRAYRRRRPCAGREAEPVVM